MMDDIDTPDSTRLTAEQVLTHSIRLIGLMKEHFSATLNVDAGIVVCVVTARLLARMRNAETLISRGMKLADEVVEAYVMAQAAERAAREKN